MNGGLIPRRKITPEFRVQGSELGVQNKLLHTYKKKFILKLYLHQIIRSGLVI